MVPSVTGKKTAHSLPEAERRDPPPKKGKGKSRRFRRGKSDGKGTKTHASHMKVPPRYAVLDCGVAKSVCGAKPIAQMAQTSAREETSETLKQSMRDIISEESEIRLSAHS